MTTTPTLAVSTMCPRCEEPAWHGVAGQHGVYGCDSCGHSIDYGCPDWCDREDHAATYEWPPNHYGPREFYPFTPGGTAEGEPRILRGVDLQAKEVDTPAKLRGLAQNALAAADWLEEHGPAHENITLPTIERAAKAVGVDVGTLAVALMESREVEQETAR